MPNLYKKILLPLICIFVASQACAVTMEDICTLLAAHENTAGDFTQIKTVSSAKRQLKSYGTFLICHEGIVWNTQKPFASVLAVKKDAVIQQNASGAKTVIEASGNPMFSSIAESLASVFSNDTTELEKHFSVSFSEAENGTWFSKLVPKDSTISSVIESIDLSGSYTAENASISSMQVTEASSGVITYIFENQRYPKDLSADEKAYFSFK